tara:strand:+ start:237 stop:461 length:225 start_codon:yes stop_codon:yes gene_type:complete
MLAIALTFSALFCILSLVVGGMVGWFARTYAYENTPNIVYTHPEMFDEHGNLLPDEILALRIEHTNDEDYDEED